MAGVAEKKQQLHELLAQLDKGSAEDEREFAELFREQLASTREPWLVEGLVDYYLRTQSRRSLKLAACIPEAQCYTLFDKLEAGLRSQQRLLLLTLLGHVVAKQPGWLYRLVKSPLFASLLRVIKHDVDIPVVMTAVLILTMLLPAVPADVGPYLSNLFEIFLHLVTWGATKHAGNTPEVLLLHVRVGTFAYFLRLYGMYPCNLVRYLRAMYCEHGHKPSSVEKEEQFEELIAPYMNQVHFHPDLLLGSVDFERSADKWRKFPSHDIVSSCTELSLENFAKSDVSSMPVPEAISCTPAAAQGVHVPSRYLKTPGQWSPRLAPRPAVNPVHHRSSLPAVPSRDGCSLLTSTCITSVRHELLEQRRAHSFDSGVMSGSSPSQTEELHNILFPLAKHPPGNELWSPSVVCGLATPTASSPDAMTSEMFDHSGSQISARTSSPSLGSTADSTSSSLTGSSAQADQHRDQVSASHGSNAQQTLPAKGGFLNLVSGLFSTFKKPKPSSRTANGNSMSCSTVTSGDDNSTHKSSSHSSLTSGTSLGDSDSLLSTASSRLHTPDESQRLVDRDPLLTTSSHRQVNSDSLGGRTSWTSTEPLHDLSETDSFPMKFEVDDVPHLRTIRTSSSAAGQTTIPTLMELYNKEVLEESDQHRLAAKVENRCSTETLRPQSFVSMSSLDQSPFRSSLTSLSTAVLNPSSAFSPPVGDGLTAATDHSTPSSSPKFDVEYSFDQPRRHWGTPPGVSIAKLSTLSEVWKQQKSLEEGEAAKVGSWPGLRFSQCNSLTKINLTNIPNDTRELMAGSWPQVIDSHAGDSPLLLHHRRYSLPSVNCLSVGESATGATSVVEHVEKVPVRSDSTLSPSGHGPFPDAGPSCTLVGDVGQAHSRSSRALSMSSHLPAALPERASPSLQLKADQGTSSIPSMSLLSHDLAGINGSAWQRPLRNEVQPGKQSRGDYTYPPGMLLDEQIQIFSSMLSADCSCLPVTYEPGCDWSHFGESPQADEVAVLQSQAVLLHCQLMLERYLRQQYAQRTHAMQTKISNMRSMEEQMAALKDHVLLQDREIQRLNIIIQLSRDEKRTLQETAQQKEEALVRQLRENVEKSHGLHELISAREVEMHELAAEVSCLRTELGSLHQKLLMAEKRLGEGQPLEEQNSALQLRVNELSKEVLAYGALMQKYREDQQVALSKDLNLARLQEQLDCTTADLTSLRESCQLLQAKLDSAEALLQEQKEQLDGKDKTVMRLKDTLRVQQEGFVIKTKTHEEKFTALCGVNQQLEVSLMELHGELEIQRSQQTPPGHPDSLKSQSSSTALHQTETNLTQLPMAS